MFVEWVDAETIGDSTWMDIEEAKERAKERPPHMRTVGFLLHVGKDFITLTDSLGSNETGHLTKIPLLMIKRKQKYRVEA